MFETKLFDHVGAVHELSDYLKGLSGASKVLVTEKSGVLRFSCIGEYINRYPDEKAEEYRFVNRVFEGANLCALGLEFIPAGVTHDSFDVTISMKNLEGYIDIIAAANDTLRNNVEGFPTTLDGHVYPFFVEEEVGFINQITEDKLVECVEKQSARLRAIDLKNLPDHERGAIMSIGSQLFELFEDNILLFPHETFKDYLVMAPVNRTANPVPHLFAPAGNTGQEKNYSKESFQNIKDMFYRSQLYLLMGAKVGVVQDKPVFLLHTQCLLQHEQSLADFLDMLNDKIFDLKHRDIEVLKKDGVGICMKHIHKLCEEVGLGVGRYVEEHKPVEPVEVPKNRLLGKFAQSVRHIFNFYDSMFEKQGVPSPYMDMKATQQAWEKHI